MENENLGEEVVQVEQKSVLHQVTPLSKYLAMALFIILPFVGGWIGYTYAPEKVLHVVEPTPLGGVHPVVVEEEGVNEDYVADSDYRVPGYGTFVYVNPKNYNISRQYFVDRAISDEYVPDDIYPYRARRISKDKIILSFASNPGSSAPYATTIYDEVSGEIVKEISYPWFSQDFWPTQSVQVFINEGRHDEPARIIVRDYINESEVVLYQESDTKIQLSDVCEVGCVGLLYVTSDGQVVFGRHQIISGTTATKLLEVVTVPLPEEQKKYIQGLF